VFVTPFDSEFEKSCESEFGSAYEWGFGKLLLMVSVKSCELGFAKPFEMVSVKLYESVSEIRFVTVFEKSCESASGLQYE